MVPENSRTTETIKHRSEEKLKQSKVTANVEVVKSSKPVDTIAEISASYDLLILGTPKRITGLRFCLEEEKTSLQREQPAQF